jgi:hypothetical protein
VKYDDNMIMMTLTTRCTAFVFLDACIIDLKILEYVCGKKEMVGRRHSLEQKFVPLDRVKPSH